MKNRDLQSYNELFQTLDNNTSSIAKLAMETGGIIVKYSSRTPMKIIAGQISEIDADNITRFVSTIKHLDDQKHVHLIETNLLDRFVLFYESIDEDIFIFGLPLHENKNNISNLIPIGILYIDEDWFVTRSNKYLENILGINESDLIGRNWLNYFDIHLVERAKVELDLNLDFIHPPHFEQTLITDFGRQIFVEVQLVKDTYSPGQEDFGYILFARDITQQVQLNNIITYAATHDKLTGISNRYLLHEKMQQCFDSALSRMNDWVCIFIDINDFKRLNDSKGHLYGDQVLIETTKKIEKHLSEDDFFCRTGGDEFVILKPIDIENHLLSLQTFLKQLHTESTRLL